MCEANQLPGLLQKPEALKFVHTYLVDAPLTTGHLKRRNRYVSFSGLSLKGADKQYAYNGYLGVTVEQHMYCKHRFSLSYPTMPCVEERTRSGHVNYYPIECLRLDPYPLRFGGRSPSDYDGSTTGAVVDQRQANAHSWRKQGKRRAWKKTPVPVAPIGRATAMLLAHQ
jgi:hypothetical protein